MEARKQDQRAVPKTYYYLDYKEFVDVVKWKMYKMQTIVRDNLRTVHIYILLLYSEEKSCTYSSPLSFLQESENKGYVCQQCKKQYSALDAMPLVDPTDNLFHCEVCSGLLEQNDNAENVQGSQEVLTRLREQSQPIIALLKLTDNIVIPAR